CAGGYCFGAVCYENSLDVW
nr:immunoglobulin heavy chain junction region [Macaca mulatta]MOW23746.1 immunoglobulin heavy chain junction region [Macaca mulatta]MOW23785.1 immunoglobulin heavy chain junction region [Macaca mulatta]MOW24099.1 immunoglobulin heavy chain junction region [Macaca mulatta]MOW24299.1 immunoglobulin heavy chain junction region [Macaca mulatta]